MGQKKKPVREVSLPPELTKPREDSRIRLIDRIEKGKEIRDTAINSEQLLTETKQKRTKWDDFNSELLKRIFNNSTIADEYNASSYVGIALIAGRYDFHQEIIDFKKSISRNITALESILERLDLFPEPDNAQIKAPLLSPAESTIASSKDIFIVHGQDDGAKETIARFVTKLDLNPIILHEQASEGRTIIEKFEDHASSVGFSIVLMTPDDMGHLKDRPEQAKPRARQNVIFELGYFIGKLTRKRVCALYKEGVEIPSDYQGVIFILMDPGGAWKYLLAKELKSSGYEIDMNLL